MVGAIRIKIEGRKLIMSTYVMADLHGRFTELNSLLKKIGFYNDGKVFRYVREEMNSVIYDIDCGAGFLELDPLANMACIRLEDEAIFYLK